MTPLAPLIAELDALAQKATQGEWAVDPDDRPDMEWNNHIVVRGLPFTICFMTHTPKDGNAAGEANTHLIAALHNAYPALRAAALAAEGMREALEGIMPFAEVYAKDIYCDDNVTAALEAARAALKAAPLSQEERG